MSNKRGTLSNEEKDYIRVNGWVKTDEEIARHLKRTTEMVTRWKSENVPQKSPANTLQKLEAEKVTIRQELRGSHKWKRLKDELDDDELSGFEEEYVELMTQFKGNVLPSEENQIFDAIKYAILKSRNMVERKKARADINRLEKMQKDFLDSFGGDVTAMSDDDKKFSMSLESQLNIARQNEQNRTNEYVKLQERQDALMKSLKATRDARVKEFESSKISYIGVIKELAKRDVAEREGRFMELSKMSGQKEGQRLGMKVAYDDGREDRPILSANTVELETPPGVRDDDQEEDS